MFKIILYLALAATLLYAENSLELPYAQMLLWSKSTEATMQLRYSDAMDFAKKLRRRNDGAGCVLENIVRISIYDDKGDTLALLKAGKQLETCNTQGLWEALRKFEIGFVQGETGHSVKGAMTTRSAAKEFEESESLEARAFFAIYAYYVDKGFSWVPFKSDNRELYLNVLDTASVQSERFWPLFLTPLIWMYYDNENFANGLALAERGLARAPKHPVLLQIKADMLYKLKRYSEAAAIYEQSANDYLKRTGESIRYWCSVLNLIRIWHDLGDSSKSAVWKAKLNNQKFKELKNWMPESLMDDLKKKKLL